MRFTKIVSSFAALIALSLSVASGCSSSSKKTGAAGGEDAGGSAGESSAEQGGNAGEAGAGQGGTSSKATTGKTTPVGGAGGSTTSTGGTAGAGGSTAASINLKDLIGAVCDWEFKCCDAGEVKWELGPTVPTAVACKSAFTYLLENDNTVSSPYPATLPSLLTAIGYSIDPTRVAENPAGIAQCIAQWNSRSCNAMPGPAAAPTHCTTTTYGVVDPCALSNLVTPKQSAGQPCRFELNQASSANDIECVAGTSCVNVGDPDNPSTTTPTCVTRGTTGAVCTSDKKCDYGFFCDTTGTGTCIAKGEPGAVCSYKNEANPVPGELTKQCMPGLTCNPVSKTCIESCKTGYLCAGSDWACPAGQSCIPITVGNVIDKFQTCSAQHSAAAPIQRCNSAEDCGAGNYCSASSCKAVLAKGATCASVAGECQAGTYCNGAACTSYLLNTQDCKQLGNSIASTSCDPSNSVGCVYKWDTSLAIPAETYVCSATRLANGERCGISEDCASNKCEYAGQAAINRTCIAGAATGAACGATASTLPSNTTTCAAGLVCKAGQCVAQVGPGGSCESTTTAGTADGTLCKNASCDATQWLASGAIMCTDAAIPVLNGGTGAMCDGK